MANLKKALGGDKEGIKAYYEQMDKLSRVKEPEDPFEDADEDLVKDAQKLTQVEHDNPDGQVKLNKEQEELKDNIMDQRFGEDESLE